MQRHHFRMHLGKQRTDRRAVHAFCRRPNAFDPMHPEPGLASMRRLASSKKRTWIAESPRPGPGGEKLHQTSSDPMGT